MPYELTPEDFAKFSQDVLSANGDQATLTALLTDMEETVKGGIASVKSSTEKLEAITKENERLKESNLKIFLQKIDQPQQQASQQQSNEPPKPLTTADYMVDYFAKRDKEK